MKTTFSVTRQVRRRCWWSQISLSLPLLVLACGYAADPQPTGVDGDFEQALEEYETGHYFDAVLKLSDFIREHPGSVLVDQAIYYRAMSYIEQKDWIMAATDFERLVRDFPESRHVCDAEFGLGETYWRQSRKSAYDQYETDLALAQFERCQARCPTHPQAAEVPGKIAAARDRLAEKQYRNADHYRKLRLPSAALVYLGLVIDDYSDTQWATVARQDRARQLLGRGRVDEARADVEWLREHAAADDDLLRLYERLDSDGTAPTP